MHFTALGGLEGHRTDGALVEELAVLLLDVALLSVEGLKNHVAVETPETGSHDNSVSFPRSARFISRPSSSAYSLVPSLARVVQTVFLHVLLQVGGATRGAALWTAVRGLVSVDAFMGSETALVGQQHGAHVTHLIRVGQKEHNVEMKHTEPKKRKANSPVKVKTGITVSCQN